MCLFFCDGCARKRRGTAPGFRHFCTLMGRHCNGGVPRSLHAEFHATDLPLVGCAGVLAFSAHIVILFVSLLINLP